MNEKYVFQPHGYTLFCEDVRHEVDGKITMVGVLGAEIVLQADLPSTLPQLSVWVIFCEALNDSFDSLTIELALPGRSYEDAIIRAEFPSEQAQREPILDDVDADELRAVMNFQFKLGPIVIDQPGRIRVRAIRNGLAIPLGSMLIRSNASENTIQQ